MNRILSSVGVGFMQFVAALLVTFGISTAIPQMNPDTEKGVFVALAGLAFGIGIIAAGWLALRLKWLDGGSLITRIVLALVGVYVPLVAALVAGQVKPASPFLTVAIVTGIVGFHAGGWLIRK